jgi:hypothetical protein
VQLLDTANIVLCRSLTHRYMRATTKMTARKRIIDELVNAWMLLDDVKILMWLSLELTTAVNSHPSMAKSYKKQLAKARKSRHNLKKTQKTNSGVSLVSRHRHSSLELLTHDFWMQRHDFSPSFSDISILSIPPANLEKSSS